MSTTHVSSGAIVGIGTQRGNSIEWRAAKDMALAWLVTLAATALFGVFIYALLRVA